MCEKSDTAKILGLSLLLLSCDFQPGLAKGESFNDLKSRADFLFYHGDMQKARDIYQDLLEMNPKADDVRLTLLNVSIKLEDNESAINILKTLIEHKPKDTFLRLLMANLLKKNKKIDESIVQLEEGLKINPKAANLHGALGFNYLDQGKTEQAKNEFEQARLNPSSYQDAQIGLSIIAFKAGKMEEAQKILNELAGKEKKLSPVVHELHGHLKVAQGKEEEALAHFEDALEAKSKSATLHTTMGNLHFKKERFEQAEKSFRKAIKLEDKTCDNYYALAVVLNKQGKKEEAASYFKQGATRDKDSSRAAQMERLANILNGNSKEAESFIAPVFPKLDDSSAQALFGASYDQVFQEMLSAPHK